MVFRRNAAAVAIATAASFDKPRCDGDDCYNNSSYRRCRSGYSRARRRRLAEYSTTAIVCAGLVLLTEILVSSFSPPSLLHTSPLPYFHHGCKLRARVSPPQLCIDSKGSYASTSTVLYGLSSDDGVDDGNEAFRRATAIGVSISPIGFLAIFSAPHRKLPSGVGGSGTEKSADVVFPIRLTSSSDTDAVTSPEALTYLQLLNGVDMATPLFGPDALSKIVTWYATLVDSDVLEVEDELGLRSLSTSSSPTDAGIGDGDGPDSKRDGEALDYVRSFVRTTLPSEFASFADASPWYKNRVKLPRVWLNGVRIEPAEPDPVGAISVADDVGTIADERNFSRGGGKGEAVRIAPVRYILECAVDDGQKTLKVPLYAETSASSSSCLDGIPHDETLQQVSERILREVVYEYNAHSSASFAALALARRYRVPVKVSVRFLESLMERQERDRRLYPSLSNGDGEDAEGSGELRYCLTPPSSETSKGDAADTDDEDDPLTLLLRATSLPFYRPLSKLREPDERVRQNLRRAGKTVEEDVKLQGALKVALERGDEAAVEKIRKAIKALHENEDAEECKEQEEEIDGSKYVGDVASSSGCEDDNQDDNSSEERVGLIAELEGAVLDGVDTDHGDNNNDETVF